MSVISFDPKLYHAYNDAIFEYFFNSDRAGQLTTLAFDDEVAAQIGKELATTSSELTSHLCGLVGSVINPQKKNPYEFWTRRGPRESAGLLACSVLVMSRLGTDHEGIIQHQGFHLSYTRAIIGTEIPTIPGIEVQDQLWRSFAAYLNETEKGALGHLSFFQVLQYRHLNYPASQCLVRMSDRRRLHALFRKYCDPEGEIDHSLVTRLLSDPGAGLSLMFRRAAREISSHDTLAKEFWRIIDSEYQVWRASPEQVDVVRRRLASRTRSQPRDQAASDARSNNDSDPVSRDSVCAETVELPVLPRRVRPAPVRAPMRRIASRLVLLDPYRETARLRVEIRRTEDGDEHLDQLATRDGWTRLDDDVSAEAFRDGFEGANGSVRFYQDPRDLCVFARSDNAWIATEALHTGVPIRLVFTEIAQPDVMALRTIASDYAVVAMSDPALFCVSMILPRDVTLTDLPLPIAEAVSATRTVIRLTSGLRLRNGTYLREGPPLVSFLHPTDEQLDVLIDGNVIGTAQRDSPFKIPWNTCDPGRRVVRISDRTRSFVIANKAMEVTEAENAPESALGNVVARYPPRIESDGDAESLTIENLSKMNAVVSLGADLLLPYSRADRP